MPNDDERAWIKTFFEGTWLITGWNARITELVDAAAPEDRARLTARMQRLGERIAPEWAKSPGRILTPDLQRWGGRLQTAVRKGAAARDAEIAAIEAEVEGLLAGGI